MIIHQEEGRNYGGASKQQWKFVSQQGTCPSARLNVCLDQKAIHCQICSVQCHYIVVVFCSSQETKANQLRQSCMR